MDVKGILEKARSEKKQIKQKLRKLARKNARDLDKDFHRLHAEVFEEIDCLDCANCCKTTSPIFRDADIRRIARHLKIKPAELIDVHLGLDAEGDYVLKRSPCVFLGEDNKCSIYEHRPKACREYPHTERKQMHQILDLTAKNTLVCPAVAQIVDRLPL
ncbi:MAG TPA: YkgJ family cysteine cluster protein [Saprospiraceae bacterium]|nr:YkgJ family cysteine cluster protein [Saprospiraceae bacterium]